MENGDRIVAALRVGQNYEGSSYSYLPVNFRRFDMAFGGETSEVPGRIGDSPAVDIEPPGDDGLLTLIHVTKNYTLTYSERAKFESFVTHKDAAWVLDAHAERGLPDDGFKEAYSRYAKSLIGIGEAKGEDIEAGLLTEIVALENPYTDDMSDGIDVRVLYEGKPRAEAQVEVFDKAPDGAVTVGMVRTDENGVATVPVEAGHRYMLDAVVLREPPEDLAKQTGAVWESLWANLTFAVPG